MQFRLIHEVGNRQRWKTASELTLASAALIARDISAMPGIMGVRVNARTKSALVYFDSMEAREQVAAYLAGLAVVPPALRDERREVVLALAEEAAAKKPLVEQNPLLGAAVKLYERAVYEMPVLEALRRPFAGPAGRDSRESQQPAELDFSPLVRWAAVSPFLPVVINTVNTVLGAVPYIFKGFSELLHGRLDVAVLDAAAIGVSLLRRDFRTAALVILLLGLGDMLERYTRKKSLASLADQLAIRVDRVWVRRQGAVVEIPLADLGPEDAVVVRSGSTIPVDGVVVAGEAAVNQATMTGEPLAVRRSAGGSVFAGTVVEDGEIDIRPTGLGDGTRLSQIVKFIENSEQSKAAIQGRVEKLADSIVPYNFALAGLVYLCTRNLTRTAAVLMVDYSCALRLATPLAILTAMKDGVKNGVLVKGGRYLEELSAADTVVFDKTGTLTEAAPKLSDVVAIGPGWSEKELLRLAACLEEHFPHPVSRAVVAAAQERDLPHYREEHDAEVKYVVAHGICSSVDGEKVIVGSRHFVEEDEGVDVSAAADAVNRLAAEGKSILYMAMGGRLLGVLGITDPVRPESRGVIEALRSRGVKRIVMLTGDDSKTARSVSAMLGIDEWHAQVLPTDKARHVQALRDEGCRVLMVGDGINDSPALSAAGVGVTLRDGSAIAQEVADVVLTRNSLEDLPLAIDLGRASMKRVHQGFAASVSLNSVFMAGGLFGLIPPALGAVLHNMTTIIICLNSMRPPLEGGSDEGTPVQKLVRSIVAATRTAGEGVKAVTTTIVR